MADLSEQLRELGRRVDARPPDDLADRVMAAIDTLPEAAPSRPPARWPVRWLPRPSRPPAAARWDRPRWRDRPRLRLVALAVGIAVLLAGGVVAVSPPVRAAIAHIFGGVDIHTGPSGGPVPTPVPSPSLPEQHRTDLAGASREVGFPVRLPAGLGPPSTVWVADERVVTLNYQRPTGLVTIEEFRGDLGPMWDKYAHVMAQPVNVGGHPGLWFAGTVIVEYIDRDGNPIPFSARRTRDTLIWTDGPLTFRLDGVPSRTAAITLADSVR